MIVAFFSTNILLLYHRGWAFEGSISETLSSALCDLRGYCLGPGPWWGVADSGIFWLQLARLTQSFLDYGSSVQGMPKNAFHDWKGKLGDTNFELTLIAAVCFVPVGCCVTLDSHPSWADASKDGIHTQRSLDLQLGNLPMEIKCFVFLKVMEDF